MWSVASLNGSQRFALLLGNRLVLATNENMSIMDTEFPIAGRTTANLGMYFGRIGQIACFLRNNEFCGFDLSTGVRRNYRLNEITGGQSGVRVQGMIDGPLVYLTGSQGVLCLNVLAAKRTFFAPWPADSQLDSDDPRLPLEASNIDQSTHIRASAHWFLFKALRCMSSIGAAAGGRLYATVTPWRLVAIRGASDR